MFRFPETIHNRRQFLVCSSVFLSAAIFPRWSNARAPGDDAPQLDDPQLRSIPRDTLLKFRPDGSPRPFAGNTVICHLLQQSVFRDAVVALGNALQSSSFAGKLAVLPGDSYHVSIFDGLNDQDRARYGWPSDIPINAPITECNRIIGERVTRFRMYSELPLRFRLSQEKTLAPQRASGLQLIPADADEKQKLQSLRNQLATEVFRYHPDDLESFGFHISLAYQLRGFTAEERRAYQSLMAQHIPAIIAAAPVIELGDPEFCTFENMRRFEIRALLRT